MDGVVRMCGDATANLSKAQEELLQAKIPTWERDALYGWIVRTQGNANGIANKVACIGLDLTAT